MLRLRVRVQLLAELSTYVDEVEKLQVEMLTASRQSEGIKLSDESFVKQESPSGGTLGQSITSEYDGATEARCRSKQTPLRWTFVGI